MMHECSPDKSTHQDNIHSSSKPLLTCFIARNGMRPKKSCIPVSVNMARNELFFRKKSNFSCRNIKTVINFSKKREEIRVSPENIGSVRIPEHNYFFSPNASKPFVVLKVLKEGEVKWEIHLKRF